MDATHAADRACSGAVEMSRFHGLSAGNSVHPAAGRAGGAVVATGLGIGGFAVATVVLELVAVVAELVAVELVALSVVEER